MTTRTTEGPDLDGDRQPGDTTPQDPPLPSRDDAPTTPAENGLGLSLSQVVGGSLAAATAAALGSRLGVAGTITGAALFSVVASVASTVYTTSLRRSRERLAGLAGTRPRTHTVLLGAALVFVVAVGGVTATELLTGRSLDGTRGGTTVSDTVAHPAPSAVPTPAAPAIGTARGETGTRTPRPSVVPTPATSAPATTAPPAPVTSTPTPSGTPTPDPSPSPAPTASPTPTATASPTGPVAPR